jgi:hypothetical protein
MDLRPAAGRHRIWNEGGSSFTLMKSKRRISSWLRGVPTL